MFGPELISQLTALFSVVMIDIVLAGDNAVVVGTAAAGLPVPQQRKVIMIGAGLALVARVLFALVAVQLLAIIGLLLAGGLLLLWVAWKMWRELHHGEQESEAAAAARARTPKTMRSAIAQVAVADISMSLDNVLAVAGAARDHPYIMIFGLVLSIALMAVAAQMIARLIDRYRWVAYVGLVIVLFVAVRMIYEGGVEVLHAVNGGA
jgi:YjbE family integral membrane protein